MNGSPVSTGTFTVAADGTPSRDLFAVDAADLQAATEFVVSIEPVPDPDPAPAAPKVLAGMFNNGTASLATGIVGDFSASGGAFFLRTPTDETSGNNGNDQYGVWFGAPGMPPAPSLNLPALPAGWAYEGWVVTPEGPLTTGTFTNVGTAEFHPAFWLFAIKNGNNAVLSYC